MDRVTKLAGGAPQAGFNSSGLFYLVINMNLKQRAEMEFERDRHMLGKNRIENKTKTVKWIMRQLADREAKMQAASLAIIDLMGYGLDEKTAISVFNAVDAKQIRHMSTRRKRAR